MNPRRNLEEGNTNTVRAFVSLFRRIGDQFQFSIDGAEDSEEVRANIILNNPTTISVTAINEKSRFDTIKAEVRDMNLNIVDENVEEGSHEVIGEYTAYSLEARAESNTTDEPWNVPHLVVYGSLTPAIESTISKTVGSDVCYTNIRNHYVLYGNEVGENSATELSDAIQQSSEFFESDKVDLVSDVRTADLV